MPDTVSLAEARQRLAELTDRVRSTGDRIVIAENGQAVAALVPPSDAKALEELEDRLDLLDALDALADYRANGGTPLDELLADLDR